MSKVTEFGDWVCWLLDPNGGSASLGDLDTATKQLFVPMHLAQSAVILEEMMGRFDVDTRRG